MIDCAQKDDNLICISSITKFLERKKETNEKIFPILVAAISLVFMSGCTTPTTKGYELAKENKFDATYAYLGVKDDVQ